MYNFLKNLIIGRKKPVNFFEVLITLRQELRKDKAKFIKDGIDCGYDRECFVHISNALAALTPLLKEWGDRRIDGYDDDEMDLHMYRYGG